LKSVIWSHPKPISDPFCISGGPFAWFGVFELFLPFAFFFSSPLCAPGDCFITASCGRARRKVKVSLAFLFLIKGKEKKNFFLSLTFNLYR